APAEEREPIEAHAEREPLHPLRIVADRTEHVRVDHPGAEDLEPAAAAAHATRGIPRTGGGAPGTRDVDLGARLGEREEARTEADARVGTEEAAEERAQHALQVRERHA